MGLLNLKMKNKMGENVKTIEVCLGVGMNQLFPETITIEIPQDGEENVELETEE
jgi:hypothetical protein